MIIMLLVFGLLPKQAQPCHGSGPQTIKGITKQNEAQVENKQGKMLRVEEANKAEGLSHLQKERKEFDQEPSGSSIYEEERVLRFMEEQEIPLGSGKVYRFIPAERNEE